MCIILSISMLSLAGIPPLGGFVAKFNILSAAVKGNFFALALVGGLNSVISLYYYLKIVRYMVFNEEESKDVITGFKPVNATVIGALCAPIVLLGISWGPVIELVNKSIMKIF